jgi:3-isopropylmalate/(R)-2-methylmalate dehydratase small subunit
MKETQKITHILGKVIPLPMNDIDTDLIIPAQYLTSTRSSGYGENVFRRLKDSDVNFVFNQAKFSDANILVAQDNFGCGSSREHAVWALQGAGIQVIIAESFADIFESNSAKNGLVLIQQPKNIINKIINLSKAGDYCLDINIIDQNIIDKNNSQHNIYSFKLEPFYQYCLVNGLDQLDYLLSHQEDIKKWSEKHVY